jgi:hypothetical protein
MPRAFKDYEIVIAKYCTRSNHITFLGEVMGYDDKKYNVRTLATTDGYHRVKQDLIIKCHVYELQRASQVDIDNMIHRQKSVLGSIMHDFKYYTNNHHYNDNMKKGLAYTSFALQRLLDQDYKRRFVNTNSIERNRYVY